MVVYFQTIANTKEVFQMSMNALLMLCSRNGENTSSLKISDKIELDERTQLVFEPKYATEW